jgi:hypothetical protein
VADHPFKDLEGRTRILIAPLFWQERKVRAHVRAEPVGKRRPILAVGIAGHPYCETLQRQRAVVPIAADAVCGEAILINTPNRVERRSGEDSAVETRCERRSRGWLLCADEHADHADDSDERDADQAPKISFGFHVALECGRLAQAWKA